MDGLISIRFTTVRLIKNILPLLCFISLFPSENCLASSRYVIQIAATKEPINIRSFAHIHKISDDITEQISDGWYRYYIGEFQSFKSASEDVSRLMAVTDLKFAFVRDLTQMQSTDVLQGDNTSFEGDSVESVNKTESIQNDTINKIKEHEQFNVTEDTIAHVIEGNSIQNKVTDEKKHSLKSKLIEYGNSHFSTKIRKLYELIIEKLFENFLVIIFSGLILFFAANLFVVLVFLNYTTWRKSQNEKFVRIYTKMYEEVILSYMFGNISWEKALIKLKKKDKKSNRRLLISILSDFKANFKGELEQFIPEIYTKLGLQNDSYKKTRSIYIHKKVAGIKELIQLYPEKAIGLIPELINDRSEYLSAEAQIAYIRLNPENPFEFFNTLKKPFTRWTQLSAFNLIRLHQLQVPDFAQFLKINHVNIRNFSLRMITYFQQLENVTEVIKMVEDKNDLTRFLAYKAINDLRLYDSRNLLKNKYWSETDKNKIEIIKAFRNIGFNEDFQFLEDVMKTESMSMKTEACRSMYFMSQDGKEKLLSYTKEVIQDIELLILHVMDSRN